MMKVKELINRLKSLESDLYYDNYEIEYEDYDCNRYAIKDLRILEERDVDRYGAKRIIRTVILEE